MTEEAKDNEKQDFSGIDLMEAVNLAIYLDIYHSPEKEGPREIIRQGKGVSISLAEIALTEKSVNLFQKADTKKNGVLDAREAKAANELYGFGLYGFGKTLFPESVDKGFTRAEFDDYCKLLADAVRAADRPDAKGKKDNFLDASELTNGKITLSQMRKTKSPAPDLNFFQDVPEPEAAPLKQLAQPQKTEELKK